MALGLAIDWAVRRESRFSRPHPPVSLAVFLTLEAAILAAWEILHSSPPRPFDPTKAKETDFTTHLHEILEDHLLNSGHVEGFTGELFSSITRPEVRNYNGKKTGKKPDMVAFLADRPNVKRTQDGIFIECKPVDGAHSLLTDYCDSGVIRFIAGDYAWAMKEALMVGYNSKHDKPSVALVAPFRRRARRLGASGKPQDCKVNPCKPPVAISRHKRKFRLNGTRMPEIVLRHLWLSPPTAPRPSQP